MKTLADILKKETESLHLQFIQKTEEFCIKYYDICKKRSKWFEVEWCNYFGIEPIPVNVGTPGEFLSYPKGFYQSKNYKTQKRLLTDIRRILNIGLERYIIQEKEKANKHYEDSINKLAIRILKKNLNIDDISVKTSHIGVNIETTLSDGINTVRVYSGNFSRRRR